MMDNGFKARVLVLGGRGMLGRRVCEAARREKYQVWATGSEFDICDPLKMYELNSEVMPHYVVNCAGMIPLRMAGRSPTSMVRVNALGPWVVRDSFPHARFIQVSTDCVFDGRQSSPYASAKRPDATSTYGRSKAMGEVEDAVVVRTSFVGPEHGLMRWLLDQPPNAEIDGWQNALWSGSTSIEVAVGLVSMFDHTPGTYHLASDVTSKAKVLARMCELWRTDVTVNFQSEPVINRALWPDVYIQRTLEWLPALPREANHAS